MSSSVVAPTAPDGDNGNPQGYCSRCHRVWTLKTGQGVCQWRLKPQAVKAPLQSPAKSSLGLTGRNGKLKLISARLFPIGGED
ncbi:hypothetical protein ACFLXU_02020 [Chloroflexota bacterium]